MKGEQIVFVGPTKQARRYAGPATRLIDARGRLLLPGFQDSHVHFVSGSLNLNRVDLAGTRSVEEIQERIRRFVAEHPDLEWIQGRGWMYSAFPGDMPHKKFLDEVVPDKPAIMRCADGHTSWVNSKALELAGITSKTAETRPMEKSSAMSEANRPEPFLRGPAVWSAGSFLSRPMKRNMKPWSAG